MKFKESKTNTGCRHKQVMIVDDNELDNFINKRILELSLFTERVYVSSGGKCALEFLTNLSLLDSPNADVLPSLIFVDINMPTIDGFEFIDRLRKMDQFKLRNCKLVILTSSLHPADRARTEALSNNVLFISKPLSEEMLSRIIFDA